MADQCWPVSSCVSAATRFLYRRAGDAACRNLLEASREAQNAVSEKLAGQVPWRAL